MEYQTVSSRIIVSAHNQRITIRPRLSSWLCLGH